MKKVFFNLIALTFGLVVSLGLVEIVFQIHNPFQFRIKGNHFVLPANITKTFENPNISKLDRTITTSKNELGFRGARRPQDFENKISLVTVGGSTTECFYLSDGETWTDTLEQNLKLYYKDLWFNNGGLDGTSSLGHFFLLGDHLLKLKPKYVLFLVGLNDVGAKYNPSDMEFFKKGINFSSINSFFKSLASYSEVVSTGLNLVRYFRAASSGLPHREVDVAKLKLGPDKKEQEKRDLEYHKNTYLKDYEDRLQKIVNVAKENGIVPIFVTQPALYGSVIDPVTGVDLGEAYFDYRLYRGTHLWNRLELYNDVTRKVAKRNKIHLSDLASGLPKSSTYYYDEVHFTKEGAQAIGQFLAQDLCPFLQARHPQSQIRQCLK